ncbi:Uncharacterised protein [Mycobacterium tuberculosis]|nr:Uncharacterised protein [Mycobacterium tuberculosis]CKV36184.1 Uncharacterised protein [Mycobacterium tuberculosis]CNM35428.1 Uncharacterised protein [Mycobacterium tuberculosis]
MHFRRGATVYRGEAGSPDAGARCFDVVGQGPQVACRADNDTHRHVDAEDLVQQVGQRQRRERVTTQVGEVRVRPHIRSGRAQQRSRGTAQRRKHRRIGTALPQLAQLVGLAIGQLGIEPLETFAIELLQLRACQLADAGEQAVLQGERRGFDDEVAWNLVGLQAGRPRYLLQGLADHGLEILDAMARKRVPGRDNHRQRVGPGTVAVDEDLSDQRAVAEHRLELRHGDELALGEL